MYPCPFVRVLVGNLALKIPVAAPPAGACVHPSASPCFAKIRLDKFPHQIADVPLVTPDDHAAPDSPSTSFSSSSPSIAARFHLSKADLARFVGKSSFFTSSSGRAKLEVSIYTGRRGSTCKVSSGQLLGKVTLSLDLKGFAKDASTINAVELHSGWVSLGKKTALKGFYSSPSLDTQLYLSVKAEPEPRFMFEFDGEPECSPQVLQVQGTMRQTVFTCKFSCRNVADRSFTFTSRSVFREPGCSRSWLSSFGSERERPGRERKGWSVTVHDLSGSSVALASMVTPFVASPGTDRVSRSNPGAWLVLRPDEGTWRPWGRLEAWRERGGAGVGDSLGYRFQLLLDAAMGGNIILAESTISTVKGGQFIIDLTGCVGNPQGQSGSPVCSPTGNRDLNFAPWPFSSYRGFVMSSTVAGEGRGGRPTVDVGMHYVGCAEDAAVFVALAAAVDLSMDACRLFSHRLRKELSAPDLLR
ncbi:hypothetical protein Cni_G16594 [Canna indica]|uniref:Uncharacterized protein n=1 Tax=Canna indica TaxID=4628 RepID=A0AAQ3QGX9_9LILI|nr:hypothetical protein Cni_G16594 [Canna indica]